MVLTLNTPQRAKPKIKIPHSKKSVAVLLLMKFPFPDSKLSPNKRGNHLFNTSARVAAREVGFYIVKESGIETQAVPLEMYMKICPPDKRRRDNDNVVSAFKSYRDGMFQALGIDDSFVYRLIVERGDIEKGGAVYVGISKLEN